MKPSLQFGKARLADWRTAPGQGDGGMRGTDRCGKAGAACGQADGQALRTGQTCAQAMLSTVVTTFCASTSVRHPYFFQKPFLNQSDKNIHPSIVNIIFNTIPTS
ncbi:hypothetical protein [Delftia sp. PS-11]|uniref:hypothetical protein n=1 Tax=Delftia sp. PS-11 TaxID=2767222 RepID=UPI002454CF52|nr:hypothetical protein [Delftia sp. PS-11]KAJ8742653.1 hypothetical protein H9T68_19440 [Delftia sp. PS-11]